jgi:hypothetical protein
VIKKSLMTVLWLCAAAGCGKHKDAEHPISWYLEHSADMQTKVAWCIDDAERQRTADCQNAIEAKRRLALGSQKSLAPIDWGATKTKP